MKNKAEHSLAKHLIPWAMAVGCSWGNALAADVTPACVSAGYVVGFFNGVLKTKADASNQAGLFKRFQGEQYTNGEPIEYRSLYNETGGLLQDLFETFEQIASQQGGLLSDRVETFWETIKGNYGAESISGRITATVPGQQTVIGTVANAVLPGIISAIGPLITTPPTITDYVDQQDLLIGYVGHGKKLILVGHSQGNLFADSAYDFVIGAGWTKYTKAVHIAPPNSSLRGPYTLADFDLVINALRSAHIGSVPNWNVSIPPAPNRPIPTDSWGHGLKEIYLNDQMNPFRRIEGDINDAFASLSASVPPSSQKCTVSGEWTGTLTQPGGPIVPDFTFSMHLMQSDNAVGGNDRISTGSFFANMIVKGNVSGNKMSFTETSITSQLAPPPAGWCIKSGTLTVATAGGKSTMTGNWTSTTPNCPPGSISLTKAAQ
ncbi:hypothetical protein [Caballeronia grimmiae]|uniref:hypothetical protein n=1 Tax=Caballeronia grimmiae TaxID=1071679 RepID=UPI0038B726CF